jgi:hypothetical protein
MQVELHFNHVKDQLVLLKSIFHNIESYGLRLFHKETNVDNMNCVELAFIQKNWSPNIRNYRLDNQPLLNKTSAK